MIRKFTPWSLIALGAFATVFVFGCVFQAFGDDGMRMEQLGYSTDHQKPAGTHENDHMNFALNLQPSSPASPLSAAVLVFLGAVLFLVQRKHPIEPVHARWRQRARRELFSGWNTTLQLFRIGILNPKIF